MISRERRIGDQDVVVWDGAIPYVSVEITLLSNKNRSNAQSYWAGGKSSSAVLTCNEKVIDRMPTNKTQPPSNPMI